eukprot:757379-Hanusia_phi.AAC.7
MLCTFPCTAAASSFQAESTPPCVRGEPTEAPGQARYLDDSLGHGQDLEASRSCRPESEEQAREEGGGSGSDKQRRRVYVGSLLPPFPPNRLQEVPFQNASPPLCRPSLTLACPSCQWQDRGARGWKNGAGSTRSKEKERKTREGKEGREDKGREGRKGRQGKRRKEGKTREDKGREGKGREGRGGEGSKEWTRDRPAAESSG